MNKKQQQYFKNNTISLEEFSKKFTPEQNAMVENEIRYYDALISLKATRKKLGLTQEEVAQKANLPRTTVTKIESGKYNPTLSTLMSIASALNKTLQIRVV
jgi:DNA-binding XRE family transcriptional regulator